MKSLTLYTKEDMPDGSIRVSLNQEAVALLDHLQEVARALSEARPALERATEALHELDKITIALPE